MAAVVGCPVRTAEMLFSAAAVASPVSDVRSCAWQLRMARLGATVLRGRGSGGGGASVRLGSASAAGAATDAAAAFAFASTAAPSSSILDVIALSDELMEPMGCASPPGHPNAMLKGLGAACAVPAGARRCPYCSAAAPLVTASCRCSPSASASTSKSASWCSAESAPPSDDSPGAPLGEGLMCSNTLSSPKLPTGVDTTSLGDCVSGRSAVTAHRTGTAPERSMTRLSMIARLLA
mmetsp:Transcript_27027/g.80140  ORF Transcript_27027/g.80140 Transcript_27027/m.80140 type:complete len:236 (-) Transcript_27027:86-793(-)